jgi:hypothetical protein
MAAPWYSDRPAGPLGGSEELVETLVPHRCYTKRAIPTKHPRHAITETPPVRAALDALRGELGDARVDLGELVILGAQAKLASVRAESGLERRQALADRIRRHDLAADVDAADEVRRSGWVR